MGSFFIVGLDALGIGCGVDMGLSWEGFEATSLKYKMEIIEF
jgi:hypothetical protein